MQLKLKLVPFPSNTPRREAVAWFVRGRSPRDWLNELNCWDVPLESLALRPIPQTFGEPTPIGLLVTQSADSSNRRPAASRSFHPPLRHGQPYGCIAGRLFVPVDAGFSPDVDDNDLLSLLPQDKSEFVWHPSAGLVRVESRERLRIVDLLTAPPERETDWNDAIPGISFHSRLISVEPDAPLLADEIFEEEASDIGSQPDSLHELPPTPDEFAGGRLHDLTRPLRDALKSLKSRFKDLVSRDPKEPTPPKVSGQVNPNPNLAGRAIGLIAAAATLAGKGLGAALLPLAAAGSAAGKAMSAMGIRSFVDQVARNREVDRLLHLLKDDPDQGLRFALSMGGGSGAEHRGKANPSNQLGTRDVGFNLDRLSGGQPVDRWEISPTQQYLLIQQYRELAAREIRLGRHRRAAYIYAELLGDLVSAAGALESGHHYREAAILYRDKLKRPADAAKCLERGGLLDEAASLYVEIGQFEKAADIYLRLERHDDAEHLLRQWVKNLISHGDFINASRVLHDKLNDVDGALKVLMLGWSSSSVALSCLERTFEILGKHARHEEAHSVVSKLRNEPVESRITTLLAKGLSAVAINYPDKTVREAAVDATQIVVARVLKTANPAEANELLGTIRKLAPQDRLLSRDCDRYIRAREQPLKPKVKQSITSRGIRKNTTFSLTLYGTKWRTAKANSKTVHVAGFGNDSLVLQRFSWDNPLDQSHRVFWKNIRSEADLILGPYFIDHDFMFVHPIGVDAEQMLVTQDTPQMFPVSSPTWATVNTVAFAFSEGGFGWRIEENSGHLVIACFSPEGEPLNSRILSFRLSLLGDWNSRVALLVIRENVHIGLGNYLLSNDRNQLFSSHARLIALENWEQVQGAIKLESAIESLIGSHNGNLIALFETGGVFIANHDHTRIAGNLDSPKGVFLSDTHFVIAGVGEVQAYAVIGSQPELIGQHEIGFVPISVTTTDKLSEFAVFGENGEVEAFAIEPG